MKIKNLKIITLMIIFLIILGTKVYATTGTINKNDVQLKKQPDSKVVLDLLKKGSNVEIIEEEDGWYKVKATTELGKVTGYVSKEYIETNDIAETNNATSSSNTEKEPSTTQTENKKEEPIQNTEPVSNDKNQENNEQTADKIETNKQYTLEKEISIRKIPVINSKQISKLTGSIKVTEIINDWARIENDNEYGWVRKNNLKNAISKSEETVQDQQPIENDIQEPVVEEQVEQEPVQQEPVIEQPQEIELNKVGYVSAEGLRVRKGPSTDTEEITSLAKNDKVEIIGQSGNWYKINIKGKIGYVSAKYISDTKIVETTSRSGSSIKNTNNSAETVEQEKVKEEENAENVNESEMNPKESIQEEKTQEEVNNIEDSNSSGVTGAEVVEYAKTYLGYKYVSGGASPKGFDCSGFTQYVYKHFEITLNRSSKDQIKNGVAVEKSNLQLGDIVIFNNDANTQIGHVGIYIGDGNFIHASNPKDGVKITTLTSGYYEKRYVGARRVI